MAPFSTRMGSIIVMIASENETNVLINCQSDPELGFEINLPLAGTPANFTTSVFEFCHILSDKPVLLAQFSLGTSTDGVREADPFMVLVPPVMQYLDVLTFRVFESLTGLNETHYINVFLPVQFDRSGFILNGESFSDDLWSPITGVDGGINAYVLQLEITTDTQMASHTDPNARLAVIVYSLEFRTGRGSSAGMMQLPIALNTISFNQPVYSALESAEQVIVALTRTGRLSQSTTVQLRSRTLSTENAAIVGEDYVEIVETITFPPEEGVAFVTVFFTPNDVFPETNKTFELYLSPVDDVYISPLAAANVIIINDDPNMPVMTVDIGDVSSFVLEGEGVLMVPLVKSEGAVGQVAVRLTTQNITATANFDYIPLDVIVTFDIDELEKTEQIIILEDPLLENPETFLINVEPINDLEAGFFPVITVDNTATITIVDNDVVVIGYTPVPCRTNENGEGLEVRVDILSGLLGREVVVQFQTFDGTAMAGEDYSNVSRSLVFTSSRRGGNRFNVFVPIINDEALEEIESFFIILSPTEQDIEQTGVVIVNSEAEVFIIDDDDALITLTLTPQVPEGGVAIATVSAQGGQLGTEVRVRVSTLNGNATGGQDFEPISNFDIILNGQTTSDSLDIQTFENDIFEGNKIFSVVAELITIGQVGINPSVASTVIIDDEEPPIVQCYIFERDCNQRADFTLSSMRDCCVSLQALSFSFPDDESGLCHDCIVVGFNMSRYVLVERNEPYPLRVSVLKGFLPQSITLGVVTTPGTATADDFSVQNSVTLLSNPEFPLSSTEILVSVPREAINTDTDTEELFRIDIVDSFGTAPSNMFFQGATISIIDYEPVVEFAESVYIVLEGDEVIVNVIISPPGDDSLAIETRLISDTAIIDEDVFLLSNFPFFPILPGFTASGLSGRPAAVLNDILFEGQEQFFVEIVAVSGGVVGPLSTATVIIEDNNDLQIGFRPGRGFDGSFYRVFEDDGSVELNVGVIEGQLATTVLIDVITFDSNAVGFVDYIPLTTTLTFNAAQQEQNITVDIINDDLPENSEFFEVRLSLFSDIERVIISPESLFIEIIDTDVPPVLLMFEELEYGVTEGGFVDVRVLLTNPIDLIQFQIEVIGGNALAGVDYEDISLRVFRTEPEQNSVRVTIQTLDDVLTEQTESLILRIIPGDGAEVGPGGNVTTLFINDNDTARIAFSQRIYSVSEDVGIFIVSLLVESGTLGVDYRVSIFTSEQGAIDGEDYIGLFEIFTLNSEITEVSFNISIIDDEVTEGDETFLVGVSSLNEFEIDVQLPESSVVLILDDEQPLVGFQNTSVVFSEFSEVGLVFLEASMFPPFGSIEVEIAIINGTAQENRDFLYSGSTFITLGGEDESLTQPIFFDILFDDVYEADEYFTIVIVSVSGGDIDPERQVVNVTIRDQTRIQVGGSVGSVSESDAVTILDLFIEGFLEVPVTLFITVNSSSGFFSATPGEDFVNVTNIPVVIVPGQSDSDLALYPITIINDDRAEIITEEVQVFIRTEMPRIIIIQPRETFEIFDDDSARISFSQTFYGVNEDAGSVEVTLSVESGILGVDYLVRMFTEDQGGSGSQGVAVDGSDYIGLFETFTLNSEITEVSYNIFIINDNVTEGDETFLVGVSSLNEFEIDVQLPESSVVLILDDEQPLVGFQNTSVVFSEFSEVGLVFLEASMFPPFGSIEVEIAIINGTAQENRDFLYSGSTFITLGGEDESLTQPIFFDILFDGVYEADEYFTIVIVSVSGGDIDPERQVVNVTIRDQTRIQVGGSVGSVSEDDGVAILDLFIEGSLEVPVTLFITVNSSSGFFSATPGEDFVNVTNIPVVILPGQSDSDLALYPITIINDDRAEIMTEEVQVFIRTEMPRIIIFQPRETFEIFDDDSARILFSQTFYGVNEDAGSVEVTLSVESGILGVDYLVRVFTEDQGGSGSQGVAVDGSDYIGLFETFILNSEITEVSFNISIINDNVTEGDETFLVGVSSLIEFEIDVQLPESSVVLIADDDELISDVQIGFLFADLLIRECCDDFPTFLEIGVVTGTLVEPITVELEFFNGTANVNSDILFQPETVVNLLPGEIEFAEISIRAALDGLYEEDQETFTARIVSVTSGSIDPGRQEATVTIIDTDRLLILIDEFSILESSEGESVVTLFVEETVNTVPIALNIFSLIPENDGRFALPGVDYTPFNQSIILEAGVTILSVSLQLMVMDDGLTEGTEFIDLLINANRSRIDVEFNAFFIVDDDTAMIGFSSTTYSEFEEQRAFIRVVMNGTFGEGVRYSVEFSTRDLIDTQAATAELDYVPVLTTLTFNSTVQVNVVPITILLDDIVELPEQFEAIIRPSPENIDGDLLVELSPNSTIITIIDQTPQ